MLQSGRWCVECANSSTCRSQLLLKPCFSSSTDPKKFDYKFSELLKKYFVKITTAKLVVISPKGGKKPALMSIIWAFWVRSEMAGLLGRSDLWAELTSFLKLATWVEKGGANSNPMFFQPNANQSNWFAFGWKNIRNKLPTDFWTHVANLKKFRLFAQTSDWVKVFLQEGCMYVVSRKIDSGHRGAPQRCEKLLEIFSLSFSRGTLYAPT